MKVAITATSEDIKGDVDTVFGRCRYFLIADISEDKVTDVRAIENTNYRGRGGVGVAAAQLVAEQGVSAVISGNVGPRAFDILSQFGIEVYKASGKIEKALQDFIEGKLERFTGSHV